MMNRFLLAAITAATIAIGVPAVATPPGKTIEFSGGIEGKVVFDGRKHAEAKNVCKDCHPDPFAMKKMIRITKADHIPGRFCGKCHDGVRAFDHQDCGKCHKRYR